MLHGCDLNISNILYMLYKYKSRHDWIWKNRKRV